MDEHFYDNEFEKFLQQQVKHHRMYPSDAVWKGIHQKMHGYKRWPGLYFFAILVVATLTVCTVFFDPAPIVYTRPASTANTLLSHQLDPVQTTQQTFGRIRQTPLQLVAETETPVTDRQLVKEQNTFSRSAVTPAYPVDELTITYDPRQFRTESMVLGAPDHLMAYRKTGQPAHTNGSVAGTPQEASVEPETTLPAAAHPTDQYLQEFPDEATRIQQQLAREKLSRWRFQFYISPSMNYRSVVDQKPSDAPFNGPTATNAGANARKVIRYNPGMGIEVGMGVLYNVNQNIRIRAGLQYNIRQFNIEAYSGSTELSKIALTRGVSVDTLQAITRYRSSGSTNEAQLLNKYHQLSIPVGVEYALVNGRRFGISLGGSLQPTYTFSPSAYLLTTDYKSYADGRAMLRKWNVNSSLEASFSFRTRKNTEWKFGPQLRYQHLPTYYDPYPIKEYLIDYGFKIGFTKTIQ